MGHDRCDHWKYGDEATVNVPVDEKLGQVEISAQNRYVSTQCELANELAKSFKHISHVVVLLDVVLLGAELSHPEDALTRNICHTAQEKWGVDIQEHLDVRIMVLALIRSTITNKMVREPHVVVLTEKAANFITCGLCLLEGEIVDQEQHSVRNLCFRSINTLACLHAIHNRSMQCYACYNVLVSYTLVQRS